MIGRKCSAVGMQALSGSGREGIQLCALVGRSPLSPDCILTKQRFRLFVYRVLWLEGNGRLFKISTDILENTRFVTLVRPLNTYLQIPSNNERL